MEHFVENNYAPGNCINVYLDGKPVFEYSCGVCWNSIWKKFRDYVKENIFDALGMDKAVYHVTPEILEKMLFNIGLFQMTAKIIWI